MTAPPGVRGCRATTSRWHSSLARCVAAPPLHLAGRPSRKLAASEPPVRLDANTNSSPLPLASAYPREPLLHGTSAGPGWPSTKAHRSSLPKVGSTSSKEGMRQLIILVHTGGSTKTQQQTWSQSALLSKRRNITIRSSGPPPAAAELKRVCRAWHESSRVKVLTPGIRRAEG